MTPQIWQNSKKMLTLSTVAQSEVSSSATPWKVKIPSEGSLGWLRAVYVQLAQGAPMAAIFLLNPGHHTDYTALAGLLVRPSSAWCMLVSVASLRAARTTTLLSEHEGLVHPPTGDPCGQARAT